MSTSDSKTPRVRLLTFNTWGLKFVSKERKARLQAIAKRIHDSHMEYDVIALQEVWVNEDWEFIERLTAEYFPYRRRFFAGIISGPGLAILSKIPIEETFLYRFPINGRPSAFWRGDWYVGKSIAVTLLKPLSSDSPPLAILNSHMHAPYALEGDAAYDCHRACQSWDFSKISRLLSRAGYAVVITGDLNSRPGSLPHKFLTLETGLVDSWEQLHGVQDLNYIKSLPAQLQIEIGGTTCDSLLNTWRQDRLPTEACRLDYALVDGNRLQTVNAGVSFTENIPNIGSYSDHFAYQCELEVLPVNPARGTAARHDDTVRLQYLSEMLSLIDEYKKTSLWQRQWRLSHFWISVVLIVAMIICTTFTSNIAGWSSIFWVIAVFAVSVTGLIDGLIGFLFGWKEWRALEEVRLEIEDCVNGMTRR
ncbi:hypothetical protein WICPIJ_007189 [Wickerhamomyces pijperi]|uniref:Endonuclease/exonuclease/phosphatase domain-containing protein n=1 Tax=Wickerhamomyces pijperi TaxID=599730 RepID=A0A9P8Q0F4_WICPI|nr:hypothetical protein WICPIJ_007189 [Wickerhamomyces pijperi]